MELTSLLQVVDKLHQVGKIDNLQQDVFGCVAASLFSSRIIAHKNIRSFTA